MRKYSTNGIFIKIHDNNELPVIRIVVQGEFALLAVVIGLSSK
ncbi:hypothetical protein [Photobacterium profundum]|nr:hypothetical protein [Photobacterium profundum]